MVSVRVTGESENRTEKEYDSKSLWSQDLGHRGKWTISLKTLLARQKLWGQFGWWWRKPLIPTLGEGGAEAARSLWVPGKPEICYRESMLWKTNKQKKAIKNQLKEIWKHFIGVSSTLVYLKICTDEIISFNIKIWFYIL